MRQWVCIHEWDEYETMGIIQNEWMRQWVLHRMNEYETMGIIQNEWIDEWDYTWMNEWDNGYVYRMNERQHV